MVKAAKEAMDVIQAEALTHRFSTAAPFCACRRQCKRGWAAWLTALADQRVNGLIPIVIDILNTRQNLQHIYNSLGQQWPLAFQDYIEQGIVDRVDSIEFDKLTKIIDPLSYLNNPRYGEQLGIPKFIINASSGDFFSPDSLLQYIDDLPGQNTIHILPNQRHYVDIKLAGQAISDYYGLFLAHIPVPNITWSRSSDNRHIEVTTHFVPEGKVKLWQAYNPTVRDFRIYPTNIHYSETPATGDCADGQCTYHLTRNYDDHWIYGPFSGVNLCS
ncbi:PhoPQ-activated protein PqaA family protein [Vibrio sp. PP-XX7]